MARLSIPLRLNQMLSGARDVLARALSLRSDEKVQGNGNGNGNGNGLLDIFDLSAVHRFLHKRAPFLLEWAPADAETSAAGAARVVLGMLRDSPILRRKFPTALSDGIDGSFCRWFCEHKAKQLGLTAGAVERVRDVFVHNPGRRALHVYLQLPSLHKTRPLAFTPAGGQSLVKWLLKQGREKYDLQGEEILWFLQQAAENPWSLLTIHYLIQPDWQTRFPSALTGAGVTEWMEWLRNDHGVAHLKLSNFTPILRPVDELRLLHLHRADYRRLSTQPWSDAADVEKLVTFACKEMPGPLRRSWKRILASDLETGLVAKPGVNIIGHFSYPSGLQRAACAVAKSLQTVGYRVSQRDQPAGLRSDTLDRSQFLGLELFDVTLSVVAPFDSIETRYQQSGLPLRQGTYRIGIWYWELDQFPPEWIERASSMQELWAPSRFIADAMRPVMPVPVYEMPPGVMMPGGRALSRASLGVAEDDLLFLFMFDMCSIMERKNPLGLIRAFQAAFNGKNGVKLVIKVLRGGSSPDDLERLQQAAAKAGVILLVRGLSEEETQGLLSSCDAYISLHRSEGFGLTIAEAMLLGKPVIATNYSGNTDFMTPHNSLLVDYKLVPITNDLRFYCKGNRWADPSVEDAAIKMRWVFENREKARILGETARRNAEVAFSISAAGNRMVDRIRQIRSALPSA